MKSPNCKCKICGKEFYQKPFRIKSGRGKYCSLSCKYEAGYSLESRQKMSNSHKGKPAWNKGIPLPEHRKQYLRSLYLGTKLTESIKKKISKALKGKYLGKNNPNWKGGIKRSGKYSYITTPNGFYMSEHRYLMEKLLNRKLTSNEVVHHINGRRDDNCLENLVVMDVSTHHSMHTKELLKKYNNNLRKPLLHTTCGTK